VRGGRHRGPRAAAARWPDSRRRWPSAPRDAGVIDLGHQIAFAHADLDLVEDAGGASLDDAGGLAHIVDFLGDFTARCQFTSAVQSVNRAFGRC
jgi:hypothetical protein